MQKSWILRIFQLLIVVPSVLANGGPETTNQAIGKGTNGVPTNVVVNLRWLVVPPKTNTVWEQIHSEFIPRASYVTTKKFGPFQIFRVLSLDSYQEIETKRAEMGRKTIESSLGYGFRETFVDTPLFDELEILEEKFFTWLLTPVTYIKELKILNRRLAKVEMTPITSILEDSIANVGEEDLNQDGDEHAAIEQPWWERLKNGHWQKGLRLFNQDPYAYLGFAVTHHHEPLLFGNVRYYSSDKLQLAFSVPLQYRLNLELNYTLRDMTIGHREDDNERWGVKLFKRLSESQVAFVGFQHGEGWRVSAGYAAGWNPR